MSDPKDKTLGIVLTSVPINDRSQLVHFYTEEFGRVTCRVTIASRGRQANRLRSMMTPMTLLEMVLGGKPTEPIRTLMEADILQSPYLLTLTHPDKSAQCLYMAELIVHTVREEERNTRLWDYLTGSLSILEHCESGWANFHLVFTCGLIHQLGFSIDTSDYTSGCCFDLKEALFTRQAIPHGYYFNAESTKWFKLALETQYDTMHELRLTHDQRGALLDMLLAFLGAQIPEMGQLRSVEVLKTLFN